MAATAEMRVGFEVLRGSGWFVPVLLYADWPLGKLELSANGVRVSTLFFRSDMIVPWSEMNSIERRWNGVCIKFEIDGVPYELDLHGLFIWSRLRAFMTENVVQVHNENTDEVPSPRC